MNRLRITIRLIAAILVASMCLQDVVWANPDCVKDLSSHTLQVPSFLTHNHEAKLYTELSFIADSIVNPFLKTFNKQIKYEIDGAVHVMNFRREASDGSMCAKVVLSEGDQPEYLIVPCWIIPKSGDPIQYEASINTDNPLDVSLKRLKDGRIIFGGPDASQAPENGDGSRVNPPGLPLTIAGTGKPVSEPKPVLSPESQAPGDITDPDVIAPDMQGRDVNVRTKDGKVISFLDTLFGKVWKNRSIIALALGSMAALSVILYLALPECWWKSRASLVILIPLGAVWTEAIRLKDENIVKLRYKHFDKVRIAVVVVLAPVFALLWPLTYTWWSPLPHILFGIADQLFTGPISISLVFFFTDFFHKLNKPGSGWSVRGMGALAKKTVKEQLTNYRFMLIAAFIFWVSTLGAVFSIGLQEHARNIIIGGILLPVFSLLNFYMAFKKADADKMVRLKWWAKILAPAVIFYNFIIFTNFVSIPTLLVGTVLYLTLLVFGFERAESGPSPNFTDTQAPGKTVEDLTLEREKTFRKFFVNVIFGMGVLLAVTAMQVGIYSSYIHALMLGGVGLAASVFFIIALVNYLKFLKLEKEITKSKDSRTDPPACLIGSRYPIMVGGIMPVAEELVRTGVYSYGGIASFGIFNIIFVAAHYIRYMIFDKKLTPAQYEAKYGRAPPKNAFDVIKVPLAVSILSFIPAIISMTFGLDLKLFFTINWAIHLAANAVAVRNGWVPANLYKGIGNASETTSRFFEKHKVLSVFAAATSTAIGGTLMKFVADVTNPLQSTFFVYLLDLAWVLLIFMPLMARYKSRDNKNNIYKQTYSVWKRLIPSHKRSILFFSGVAVFGSLGFYYVLPHVTAAVIYILMQMGLLSTLLLSYFYLGEKKGWPRKLLGIGILTAAVAVMTFAEATVNAGFFGDIWLIAFGAFIGVLWGFPGIFIRKMFKEAEDRYGKEAPNIVSLLPMVIIATSYILGTPLLFIFSCLNGVNCFSFIGTGALYPLVIISAAAFFFVISWGLTWKLSRMVHYDLSKIGPGGSSASMITALLGLGLYLFFGISSDPFSSNISWIAPIGVIIGAYIAASGKDKPPAASSQPGKPNQVKQKEGGPKDTTPGAAEPPLPPRYDDTIIDMGAGKLDREAPQPLPQAAPDGAELKTAPDIRQTLFGIIEKLRSLDTSTSENYFYQAGLLMLDMYKSGYATREEVSAFMDSFIERMKESENLVKVALKMIEVGFATSSEDPFINRIIDYRRKFWGKGHGCYHQFGWGCDVERTKYDELDLVISMVEKGTIINMHDELLEQEIKFLKAEGFSRGLAAIISKLIEKGIITDPNDPLIQEAEQKLIEQKLGVYLSKIVVAKYTRGIIDKAAAGRQFKSAFGNIDFDSESIDYIYMALVGLKQGLVDAGSPILEPLRKTLEDLNMLFKAAVSGRLKRRLLYIKSNFLKKLSFSQEIVYVISLYREYILWMSDAGFISNKEAYNYLSRIMNILKTEPTMIGERVYIIQAMIRKGLIKDVTDRLLDQLLEDLKREKEWYFYADIILELLAKRRIRRNNPRVSEVLTKYGQIKDYRYARLIMATAAPQAPAPAAGPAGGRVVNSGSSEKSGPAPTETAATLNLRFYAYSDLPTRLKTNRLYKLIRDMDTYFSEPTVGKDIKPDTLKEVWKECEEEWRKKASEQYRDAMIAFDGDRPVGIWGFSLFAEKRLSWDEGVYVAEDYRLRGTASMLRNALAHYLKNIKIRDFRIGDFESEYSYSAPISKQPAAQRLQKSFVEKYPKAVKDVEYDDDGNIVKLTIKLHFYIKYYGITNPFTTATALSNPAPQAPGTGNPIDVRKIVADSLRDHPPVIRPIAAGIIRGIREEEEEERRGGLAPFMREDLANPKEAAENFVEAILSRHITKRVVLALESGLGGAHRTKLMEFFDELVRLKNSEQYGKLLKNLVIIRNHAAEGLPAALSEYTSKPEENAIFVFARAEVRERLRGIESKAKTTYIEEGEFSTDPTKYYYYPLVEIITATLARHMNIASFDEIKSTLKKVYVEVEPDSLSESILIFTLLPSATKYDHKRELVNRYAMLIEALIKA